MKLQKSAYWCNLCPALRNERVRLGSTSSWTYYVWCSFQVWSTLSPPLPGCQIAWVWFLSGACFYHSHSCRINIDVFQFALSCQIGYYAVSVAKVEWYPAYMTSFRVACLWFAHLTHAKKTNVDELAWVLAAGGKWLHFLIVTYCEMLYRCPQVDLEKSTAQNLQNIFTASSWFHVDMSSVLVASTVQGLPSDWDHTHLAAGTFSTGGQAWDFPIILSIRHCIGIDFKTRSCCLSQHGVPFQDWVYWQTEPVHAILTHFSQGQQRLGPLLIGQPQ